MSTSVVFLFLLFVERKFSRVIGKLLGKEDEEVWKRCPMGDQSKNIDFQLPVKIIKYMCFKNVMQERNKPKKVSHIN